MTADRYVIVVDSRGRALIHDSCLCWQPVATRNHQGGLIHDPRRVEAHCAALNADEHAWETSGTTEAAA